MEDNFHKSHDIADRIQEIMREIDHHQQTTHALDHSHHRWESPLSKPRSMNQPETSLTQILSFFAHDQPSVTPETKILSKTSNPVMQEGKSGHTKMEDTNTMSTPHP